MALRRTGRIKTDLDEYRQKCLNRIAALTAQMAATDKKDPNYLRLSKQKLAQETRLKNRQKDSMAQQRLDLMDSVIQAVLNLSYQYVKPAR